MDRCGKEPSEVRGKAASISASKCSCGGDYSPLADFTNLPDFAIIRAASHTCGLREMALSPCIMRAPFVPKQANFVEEVFHVRAADLSNQRRSKETGRRTASLADRARNEVAERLHAAMEEGDIDETPSTTTPRTNRHL